MLLNDFFTIIDLEQTENTIVSRVSLSGSHPIFEGHFPGNPVTPGVVQIQMVKELLEKARERNFTLKEVGRCKFMAILNPAEDQEFDIRITWTEEDGRVKINALGTSIDQATTFFKFAAKYQ